MSNLFSQNDLRSCVKKAYIQEKLPNHRQCCIPQFKSMTVIPLSSYNDATKLLFMAAAEYFVSLEGLQRSLPRGTKHSSLKRGAPIVLDASTQKLSHYIHTIEASLLCELLKVPLGPFCMSEPSLKRFPLQHCGLL